VFTFIVDHLVQFLTVAADSKQIDRQQADRRTDIKTDSRQPDR
jgi:hypothetical protein